MQFSRISDFYYRQEITYDIFDVTQQHTLAAVTLQITEGDMRMMLLLWDVTSGNRSLKIVEIPVKTTPRALNNPDFPER